MNMTKNIYQKMEDIPIDRINDFSFKFYINFKDSGYFISFDGLKNLGYRPFWTDWVIISTITSEKVWQRKRNSTWYFFF